MRISDWSSDVCSSDLSTALPRRWTKCGRKRLRRRNAPHPTERGQAMTDEFLHPTPDYDATDWEQRQYVDGDGQPLEVTLERFYWLHLAWYDAKGLLFSEGGLGKLLARLEHDRGAE